jgi:Zn-dependent peptidase ImmA (M78 family)
MDPTALSKVLSGRRRLSALELALIAETTGRSAGELLGSEDAGERVAARAQPRANPAVSEALGRVKDLLGIDALLSDVGIAAPPSVLPLKISGRRMVDQAANLARDIRDVAGIGDAEIPELAEFCERRLGIDVAVEPLPQGLDGLSVARGNYRLALISSSIPATRQRYTLAHEAGHLAAGDADGDTDGITVDEDLYGSRSNKERRANSFAAALIMPENSLRADLGPGGPTEASVSAMLLKYKVSVDALAFRLHNVHLVDEAGRDRVRAMSARKLVLLAGHIAEYQRQLQDVGARRFPAGLLSRTLEAYNSGKVSVRILARLVGIPADVLLDQLRPLPPMTDEQKSDDTPTLVL